MDTLERSNIQRCIDAAVCGKPLDTDHAVTFGGYVAVKASTLAELLQLYGLVAHKYGGRVDLDRLANQLEN